MSPLRAVCRPPILALALLVSLPSAFAAGSGVVGENLLWLAIILMAARLFAPLTQRIGFPAVLGELLLGVVLGNLVLVGINYFDKISGDPIIAFLAELGVIGIALPFALGAYVVGPLLLPGASENTYLFLGATLSATSVGITGRVFRDLGRLAMPEAKIVLGAAVIDDVLGLVILAVVSSLVQAGSVSLGQIVLIIAEAILFLGGSIIIGRMLAKRLAGPLAQLDRSQSMLFALVLASGLFLAWLAHAIGLAPIIGAFAAGLLFEPVWLKDFDTPKVVVDIDEVLATGERPDVAEGIREILKKHTRHQHEHMVEPIGYFFVPVFFVLTGMQVDLKTLADPQIVFVALGITAVAVAGKLIAGFAAGRGHSPWIVGWGMVPRGEVGLIFAAVGRQLGVVDEAMFSVIVIMVILTTLATPPILTVLLRRQEE